MNANVELSVNSSDAIQFKAHPNVDKNQWSKSKVIAPKDPSKPFSLLVHLPVLKWRFQTKDETMLPFLVSVWPSASDKGLDVCVEYELLSEENELRNVSIDIGMP